MDGGAWQAAVRGVEKSQTRLSNLTFTFHFDGLEKEMATHSSVLAQRIPGTAGGGGGLEGCCLWGCTESDMTEATYQQQQHPRSVRKTNSLTVTEVKSYEERLAWWINGYGSQHLRRFQVNNLPWYSHPCVVLSQNITGLTCEIKKIEK